MGRGASVFIVDAYSLVFICSEKIITAGAIASGAQDLNIRASSQVIDAHCLIGICSEEIDAIRAEPIGG